MAQQAPKADVKDTNPFVWMLGLEGLSQEAFGSKQFSQSGPDPSQEGGGGSVGYDAAQAEALYQQSLSTTKEAAGEDQWKEAVSRGYISEEGKALNIPQFGPSQGRWTVAGMTGSYGPIYNDPVYGPLQQLEYPEKDLAIQYGPAIVGLFAAPALAGLGGMLASAVGLGGSTGATAAISTLFKSIPSLAASIGANGGLTDSTLYSTLAKVGGAATGIPGAAQAAGAAWNLVNQQIKKP